MVTEIADCPHRAILEGIGGWIYCDDCRNLKCSFCDTIDGAVGTCEWCGRQVCLEHDDVLENRGIDSGLSLCEPCGEKYDNEHGIKYGDCGNRIGDAHCFDCGIADA